MTAAMSMTRVAPGIRLRTSGRYDTRLGDKYLGSFCSQALAELARQQAKAKAKQKKSNKDIQP